MHERVNCNKRDLFSHVRTSKGNLEKKIQIVFYFTYKLG